MVQRSPLAVRPHDGCRHVDAGGGPSWVQGPLRPPTNEEPQFRGPFRSVGEILCGAPEPIFDCGAAELHRVDLRHDLLP
jgi:hypothetical protein